MPYVSLSNLSNALARIERLDAKVLRVEMYAVLFDDLVSRAKVTGFTRVSATVSELWGIRFERNWDTPRTKLLLHYVYNASKKRARKHVPFHPEN